MNKPALHQHLLQLLQNKLNVLEASFAEKREDLLSESKSTAGDKHETGRAMIQLEQEKLSGQLLQVQKQRDMLLRINPEREYKTVQAGALVQTNKGMFYITTGLGQVELEGISVFAIAPTSPVAQAMLGKKASENFEFNSNKQTILKIT